MKKRRKITQNERVLNHMIRHTKTGITSLEAFNKYGITRLSGRIFDLKAKGVPINTINGVKAVNRYADECSIAKYILTDTEKAKKILEDMRVA